MKVLIWGVGLLGGSFGLNFKRYIDHYKVYGIDKNTNSLLRAKELNIIDEVYSGDSYEMFDYIILAATVEHTKNILPKVLNNIGENTAVLDVGSTKNSICNMVANHPNRKNFVAYHPIAGTEFSGPDAAFSDLLKDKLGIICEAQKTAPYILEKVKKILTIFKTRLRYISAEAHDKHLAYVSHLSHISSFMLGKTVIEKEKDEQNIFDMAGSGFESTVRLAKSSPDMWASILKENNTNVLNALNDYIVNLMNFRDLLDSQNFLEIYKELENTNRIKQILT